MTTFNSTLPTATEPSIGPSVLEAIQSHAWYSEMPARLASPFLAGARLKRFAKGEPIYSAGEEPKGMYCVLSGMVLMTASGPGAKASIPFTVDEKAWFGLCEVFNRKPSPLTAIAGSDCTLLLVRNETLEALTRSQPDIWQFIGRILARQTQKLAGNLLELIYLPAPAKVARRLLALSLQDGGAVGEYRVRVVNISHEQLGSMLSISRQIVSKILKGFEKERLITCGYKSIFIENAERLRRKSEILSSGYPCD